MYIKTTLAALVIFAMLVSRSTAQDARMLPVSATEVASAARQFPPNSAKHFEIISRAYYSGLSAVAYKEYAALASKLPQNPYACTLAGTAAQEYFRYITLYNIRSSSATGDDARSLARRRFSEAFKINPNLPEALREYGFYLWQYDNQMAAGLKMVEKSLALKKDALTYVTMGGIYSNKSGNAYSLIKSKKMLDAALSLDPNFAKPHWLYVYVYIDEKQYGKARHSLDKYLALAPPSVAKRPEVIAFKTFIENHLTRY